MLFITRGTTNTIILTLTEKISIGSSIFLFVFENDQTRQTYACIAADISEYTYRYNEFLIIEKSSPNAENGEISLSSPGDYHYFVYQQNSTSNLDPTMTQGLLKSGKLTVIDTDSAANNTYDSETKTNIVYGE